MNTLKLNDEEMKLIISALDGDRLGKWGDGRGEAIERLIKKIKRQEKVRAKEEGWRVMKKRISVTIRDNKTGEESERELSLTPQQYHLIGHEPYATEEFVVVAVNGERLNEESGTYYA